VTAPYEAATGHPAAAFLFFPSFPSFPSFLTTTSIHSIFVSATGSLSGLFPVLLSSAWRLR
ncbi:MAG: hypothetical protein K2O88_09965, partial [Paramuribaculum sp.]|nr:hypothetical protein [Paramuribaculum sp.]